MSVKQLSVFVENKPGRLVEEVKSLADAGVNIRAMSIADTKDFGILRLIVPDVQAARAVLGEGTISNVTEVVCAEMKDESGALYNILKVLADAQINIDYMYAFTGPVDAGAYVVLRVDNNEIAEQVLRKNGIQVLSSVNI